MLPLLRSSAACALALVVLSCARNPDFSFVNPADRSVPVSKTHKVITLVSGSADILWVIDNSGSMSTYQQAVQQNALQFIQGFQNSAKGVDWRIGLISTDEGDSPYVGFDPSNRLDANAPDPVATFTRAVGRLGILGSATEKAFEPIKNAFDAHPDFVRPAAKLFLILLSDELEQSDTSTVDFIDYLRTLKGDLAQVVTYGIFTEETCGDPGFKFSKYGDFIGRTFGKYFPICSPSYGSILGQIGRDILKRFSMPLIKLADRPVLGSIRVSYKGRSLRAGRKEDGGFWLYDYDSNSIQITDMSFAPGDDESVEVDYRKEP